MKRWIELLEGENNRLSMYRLMQFLAYPPASYVLISIHTTEALAVYLGAFVVNTIGNKYIDTKGRKSVKNVAANSNK